MNKHLVNGIAAAILPLGLGSGAAHAYHSYVNRSYARQIKNTGQDGTHNLINHRLFNSLHATRLQKIPSQKPPLTTDNLNQLPSAFAGLTPNLQTSSAKAEASVLARMAETRLAGSAELTIKKLEPVNELIIIDQSVPDKHLFYQQLKPGIDIVEIDADKDGLMQLENLLQGYSNLDALHIVSHADDGVIYLGNNDVTAQVLEQRLSVLSQLDNALKDGADLLLYGCDLAKTGQGEDLLELISQQADVDVAASNNLTGTSGADADWKLEIHKGAIESQVPFSAVALQDFSSVLAINNGTGKTVTTSGFPAGYANTKSYDVDGSGFVLRLSTSSVSASALYCGFGYCSVNFGGGLSDTESLYIEFTDGSSFDIDSIQAYSPAGNNTYVFTPSSGTPANGNGFNLGFATQNLNFTNITRLTITRQDGGDLNGFDVDNLVIKNATAPDSTPPVFQNSTPSVSATTISQTTLTVRQDEAGTAYYVLVPDGAGAPSSAQVKAGNNSSNAAAFKSGSINVTSSGSDFNTNITGLASGTAYDLYVAAEDGIPNIQASPTRVDFSTNPQNSDASLTVAAGVAEPIALSTTVDTLGESTNLFDFTLSDGGGDSLALGVSQIVLNVSGTSSDTERDKVTWRLNGADATNVTGIYNAGSDTLTFSGLSISVADGASEVYTVNAYYNNNTGITDGRTVILSVDGDTDVTVSGSGTLMGATSAVNNGAGTEFDVQATTLVFTTQPAGSVSGSVLTTQPVVAARDAFGNTDTDFTETITLTEGSAGLLSGDLDIAAVSGVSTYTDVAYGATADQQSFTLNANDQDGVGTNLAPTNANAVTSDVVATQLVYDTQPVPLSVVTATATNFSTVPVVSARDAANIVDTGYSTNIVISEINGAGSATLSGTGDADGSAATVTIAPSSGVSTFTGLQITYTNSGGSNENFNLRASSGGLTPADSSQLTGTVPDSDGSLTAAGGVSEPVALNYSVDTVGESTDLFDFTLTDGGGGDGLPMTVSQIVVNVSGTASDTDRAKITWRLNGADASNVTGVYNAGADTITFNGLTISVADGASEVYTINAYYNDNTGLTHGNTVILSVDGDTDLTVGASSTQMGSTTAVNNNTGTVISDDISPTVTSVNVPANSTYTAAANLDFTVNFNENVVVNTGGGTPRLSLTVGATTRFANYLSGSGTSALLFRYTVPAGDQDLDGIALGAAIDSNSGTLRDSAGNNINTTLNSVGSLASVFVDALAPVAAEVTPVVTPGTDSTPDVTFSATEAGTLAVGGSCGSGDEGAVGSGNTTITLTQPDNSTPLASGTYSDCTVTVTDSAGNASNPLSLTSFTIDVTDPALDTNTGEALSEGDTGVTIVNTELSASDNISAAANVTYTLVGAPANGTLRNNGGALTGGGTFTQADVDADLLTYDHDGSETLSDTFTFTLTDGAGNVNDNGAANFTFNFTIAAVNDPPDTTVDADTTNEDNAVMVDVLANDNDVDGTLVPSSVTVTSAASNGGTSVNVGTGVITYTPNANFEGMDSFAYTVEDNNMLASSATTVTITVNPLNDPPVAVADMVNTPQDTLIAIDVAANDTDIDTGDNPDPTTIVVVGAASNGSAVFNGGTNRVDYTPNGGFTGTDTFTYTIDDGTGATSNVATVTVNVISPNTAPTAVNDNAATAEDNAVVIAVLGNDSDADGALAANTVTVQSGPSNGNTSVNAANGAVTYTPSANFNGNDSFTYTVRDDDTATSNAATVSISVSAVNDAPVAVDDTATVVEDSSFNINVLGNDSDVDGSLDAASVTVIAAPESGAVEVNNVTGMATYTPADDFAGGDSFTYQVSDNLGAVSNVATVTLTVDAVNDPPLANNDSVVAVIGQATLISPLGNDSDIDGTLDAASIAVQAAPAQGALVNNNDGTLTYTSDANASGSDSFTYSVSDNDAAVSNVASVSIRLSSGVAPVISGDPAISVVAGSDYSFTPMVEAEANAELTFDIVNAPTWASFSPATGTLSGTPVAEDAGTTAGIVISVDDGLNSAALAPFSLTVSLFVDTDNDGLPDSFEEANGLDPNVDDAAGDLDGDGTLNIDEYLNETDPQADDYGPVITLTVPLVIDATALLTPLPVNVTTATDGLDGATLVSNNLDSNLLAPGRYSITWSATDSAGNTTTQSQSLDVRPLASWQVNQEVGEGGETSVTLYLNGEAPEYPVVAQYSISGTATNPDDHNATSGTLTIDSGVEASLNVAIVADDIDETDETLIVSLDSISNAAIGVQSQHTLTISEMNHTPAVSLTAALTSGLGNSLLVFSTDGGEVTVTALVTDVDSGDSHSFEWDDVDGLGGVAADNRFSFDPSGLSAGVYQLSVTATDDADNPESGSNVLNLVIVDEVLALSAVADTDSDGIDDATEGYADLDQDNVPDYLDSTDQPNLLAMYPAGDEPSAGAWFVEAQPGLQLQLNVTAVKSEDYSPLVSGDDVNAGGVSDEDFNYDNGLFDFVVSGLETQGDSVLVVLPQLAAIPADAVYRKQLGDQWQGFAEDANNGVSSAAGVLGLCPPVGSDDYQPGLAQGHFCVQLQIEDGGANDADGEANGVIVDPGGVASEQVEEPPVVVVGSRRGGGGCSVAPGSGFDPLLPLLVLLSSLYLWRRNAAVVAQAKSSKTRH